MIVDVDPAAARARPPADSRQARVSVGLERIFVLRGSRWSSRGRERTAFATGERGTLLLATAGQAGFRRRAGGAA